MVQLAQAQFTLTDDTDIVISIEPPENAIKDMLWLDISTNPIQLKRWSGVKGYLGVDTNNQLIPINSKTNYSCYNNDSIPMHINNLNEIDNFILYDWAGSITANQNNDNLYNNHNWQLTLNNISLTYENFSGPDSSLSYLTDFKNVCTLFTFKNLTFLVIQIYQGSLWCPVNQSILEKTVGELMQSMEEKFDILKSSMPDRLTLDNITIPVQIENNQNNTFVRLYDYKILNDHGISFKASIAEGE